MALAKTVYPLSALRTVALHSQGLAAANHLDRPTTPDDIYSIVDQIGCVQIDTLHMVQRSQYVTIWSRLGTYDPADFDRLIYTDENRRLYEYWLHAACIIPLADYRYSLPKMDHYRSGTNHRSARWLRDPDNRAMLATVQERLRDEGALRTKDFEHVNHRGGSWWNWKPAKFALEHLYNLGDVMIADRVNFQRVYDLRDRVLPEGVDKTEPSHQDVLRYYLARGAKSFGVCEALQTTDLAYFKRTESRPVVEALIKDGTLVEIEGELVGGQTAPLVIHVDNLPLLEQAADGAITAERTTFLSPFDNVFWPKNRDMQFWNFRKVLEAYKPAADREWGYFCLPILHRDRMVGRFDPKLERKKGVLRLKALYLEPGIAPGEALVADVAEAMRNFMTFHNATELVIERSDPVEFGDKLLATL